MNDIQNIITERVDDIPLLLEQMQRMHLPTLMDHHFPTHGNWQGLSLGWVSTIWLRGYPETTLGKTVYLFDSERISPQQRSALLC